MDSEDADSEDDCTALAWGEVKNWAANCGICVCKGICCCWCGSCCCTGRFRGACCRGWFLIVVAVAVCCWGCESDGSCGGVIPLVKADVADVTEEADCKLVGSAWLWLPRIDAAGWATSGRGKAEESGVEDGESFETSVVDRAKTRKGERLEHQIFPLQSK